jgi:tetratricopeptide (TPR) repeat protein
MKRLLPGIAMAVALLAGVSASAGEHPELREARRLAERGQFDEALKSIDLVLAADPGKAHTYEVAVPIWFRAGALDRAQRALEAYSLRCHSCAFAWYALGATYRKQKRFDLAVLAYEEYLKLRPDNPDGLFGYAMALVATDDTRSAAVLTRYLEVEERPDRAAFRAQAFRALDALGGFQHPRPAWRSEFDALVDAGRLVSAEALAQRSAPTGEGLRARRVIAQARDRGAALLVCDVLTLLEKPLAARSWIALGSDGLRLLHSR